MTAPGPMPGANIWTGTYQAKQYDTTVPPRESPLDALADPPDAAIAAETSPDHLFAENTDPPVGAGGNTGDGSRIGLG